MVACVWVHALWCACMLAVAGAAACPPCPPPPHGLHCSPQESDINEECHYTIRNITRVVIYNAVKFEFKCVEGLTLEEPALPRFLAPVAVPSVTLRGCGLPGTLSLAAALGRLNVRALDRLQLLQLPRALLHAHHLAGLASLRALHVAARDATGRSFVISSTDVDIFSPLSNLISLKLEGVRLPAAALSNISSWSLSSLELVNVGLKELPLDHLCRLPRLSSLLVRDRALESLPSVCNLTFLTLGRSKLRRLPPLHSVVNLTLSADNVIELNNCTSLKYLTVTFSRASAFPGGWLSQCLQLEQLKLTLPRVTALTNRTLCGAVALRKLTIESNYRIRELEKGFFDETRNLEDLILSRNHFTSFPDGLFAPLSNLHSLDLSHNYIRGAALSALSGLPMPLRRLGLSDNPLGDLCPLQGTTAREKYSSPLLTLRTLEMLSLEKTRAERICPGWRQNLAHLKELDLQKNNITKLGMEDLKWGPRNHTTEVRLSENPLQITLNQMEYDNINKFKLGHVKVKFILDNLDKNAPLRCDCHMYWFARALREGKLGARFENLRCAAPSNSSVPFGSIEPEHMVCPAAVDCPSNCSCVLSPAAGGLLAECHDLVALSAESAHALFTTARRVRLQGKSTLCTCDQPFMIIIRDHQHQVLDLPSVKCADGRSMLVAIGECFGTETAVKWRTWGMAGSGLALLVAMAALVALQRCVRLRLKAFLLARGLCLRWVRPDDDGFEYDAFLSYAHADSVVAAKLLAALEGDGLRLCVHHRDWRPGDWIPNQIIESVAASRRTVVLLSEAFVRSGWARAEFREAYARALGDGAVRLVVVVLGSVPLAQLDSEMLHYVINNTYVRWGEPDFWRKLLAAMPPSRPHGLQRKGPKRPKVPPPEASAFPNTAPPSDASSPQPPPTPIVKFAQMDFPTPNKPLKQAFI